MSHERTGNCRISRLNLHVVSRQLQRSQLRSQIFEFRSDLQTPGAVPVNSIPR